MAQRPDATRVAGYRTWHSLGRQVSRGERGIAILAPITYRREQDDDHGDGEAIEEREQLAGFRIQYVWDISQTTGDPLPDVAPQLLDGDAPAGLAEGLGLQIEGEGYTLHEGECRHPRANGETDPMTRTVTLRPGLSAAQQAKTLAHELAHIRLGHVQALPSSDACLGRYQVEAESVAYLVCHQAGLDSAAYSVAYTAGWAAGNPDVLRDTAERVITVARAITTALAPYPTP